jgi:hypothetical protein
MFGKTKTFLSQKAYLPVFLILLLAYFLIGFFQINYTPITTDEIAHLSAGQGITQGLDLNLEHPPLLKALDSIPLGIFFSNFKTSETGQWSRSVEFLTKSEYNQSQIILVARSVYLIFNSLLILWLILYTCVLKKLDPKFSLILATLYTFSPPFFGQDYIIAFDVAGSITALMTMMSFAVLIYNLDKLSKRDFRIQLGIFTVLLFAALNSKFSNYLLLPILVLVGLWILGKSLVQKNWSQSRQVLVSGVGVTLVVTVATWILFAVCYRNGSVPSVSGNDINIQVQNSWFADPFIRLATGLLNSLGRSNYPFSNFIDDHYEVISFADFIKRVFWYKENPGLFFFFEVTGILGLIWLGQKLVNWRKFNLKEFVKIQYNNILVVVTILLFPVIYIANAWNSQLTIGYRHFYPVLIFIYFGTAWLSYIFLLKNPTRVKNIATGILLGFYVLYGLIGVPQSLSYVNFLWTKPKWQLITDSTVSWTETGGWAIRYMTQNHLLDIGSTPEDGKTWNTVFDVAGGPTLPTYVDAAMPKGQTVTDPGSVLIDLSKNRIKDIQKKYVALDIFAIQRMSNEIWLNSDNAEISKENMDYIQNVKPIYSLNDTVFIYQLN